MRLVRSITQPSFSIPFEVDGLVAYTNATGKTITLAESEGFARAFAVGEGLAVCAEHTWKCYLPDFVAAGWQPRLDKHPIAFWNLQTGERLLSLQGLHWGDLMGAELLDDKRLLTWGRDYLGRVWDRTSGACLDTFPLPFGQGHLGVPSISCLSFAERSAAERLAFCDERNLAAPNLEHHCKVSPSADQLLLGRFQGQTGNGPKLEPVIPEQVPLSPINAIADITGAEAGYSTVHRLADGRLLMGGTTYGAAGYVYVWDGLFDLKILYPGQASVCFEIDGEVEPGVVQMSELDWVYRFRV